MSSWGISSGCPWGDTCQQSPNGDQEEVEEPGEVNSSGMLLLDGANLHRELFCS